MRPLRHYILQYPMDHGAASYKVPNCSDHMRAWNWEVSNLTGYLWGLTPDTNSFIPLLQHSALFPDQGMVDQSWCAVVVPHGSNVQETAQAVEDWEVILCLILRCSFNLPLVLQQPSLLSGDSAGDHQSLSPWGGFQNTTPAMITWRCSQKQGKWP